MGDVTRPFVFGRRAFAEVVYEAAKRTTGSILKRHACSNTIIVCTPESISGCHFSGCGHAEQRFDLGKNDRERIRLAQHLEKLPRRRHLQRFVQLLPHSLGNERLQLTARRDLAHQRASSRARP